MAPAFLVCVCVLVFVSRIRCVCVSIPIISSLSIRALFSTNLLASRSQRRPRAPTLRYVSVYSGRARLPSISLQSFPQSPLPYSAWLLPLPATAPNLGGLSARFIPDPMIIFPVYVCAAWMLWDLWEVNLLLFLKLWKSNHPFALLDDHSWFSFAGFVEC